MNALIATAFGLGVGLGVLLLIQGARGKTVVPAMEQIAPNMRPDVALAWFSAGLLSGLVTFAFTGWIVLAVVVGWSVMVGHRMLGGNAERTDFIARTQAIASWADMIRDNMAAAAGLEQALVASAKRPPHAIETEVRRFANRLQRMPLLDALQMLQVDLKHPSGDLVVVSLANATRLAAQDLGPLLSRLSDAIRSEVRMRTRVEVGRARIRTSARIVVGVMVFTLLFLLAFGRNLLDAYSSLEGQLWMFVVFGVMGIGAWMLRKYGEIEMPERFAARRAAVVDSRAL